MWWRSNIEGTKCKKLPLAVRLLLILLAVTMLLCCTVAGLWLHGRSSVGSSTTPTIEEDDGEVISYQGKEYRYREDTINILLMGIDADSVPTAGSRDQADAIILASLRPGTGQLTLTSLSRDTVCNMTVLHEDGTTGLTRGQLALSYAYGDGLHESCRLTCEAVSGLLYGLPIHGYGAFYMSGVGPLNDAVGGVTVTVIEDFPFSHVAGCHNMIDGHEVTLTGEQAHFYMRARLEEQADANDLRIVRQKQYLTALMDRCMELVQQDPTQLLGVYNAAAPYLLTDLSFSRIAYLASEALQLSFDGEIHTLPGTLALNAENQAELTLDQSAVLDWMIGTFYEEVSPQTTDEVN